MHMYELYFYSMVKLPESGALWFVITSTVIDVRGM